MLSVIVTCYTMFGWYPWEVCSFLKGKGATGVLGERKQGGGEGLGERRGGKPHLGCNI